MAVSTWSATETAIAAKPGKTHAAGRSGKAQTERVWLASVPSLHQLRRELTTATSNSDAVLWGCPGAAHSRHGLVFADGSMLGKGFS